MASSSVLESSNGGGESYRIGVSVRLAPKSGVDRIPGLGIGQPKLQGRAEIEGRRKATAIHRWRERHSAALVRSESRSESRNTVNAKA